MIDRRSHTDRLVAADQVLVGATLRDRFLTAFILRNAGLFVSSMAVPLEAACCQDSSGPAELDVDAVSFAVIHGEAPAPGGNGYEPLALGLIEEWPLPDGEDDM